MVRDKGNSASITEYLRLTLVSLPTFDVSLTHRFIKKIWWQSKCNTNTTHGGIDAFCNTNNVDSVHLNSFALVFRARRSSQKLVNAA